MRSIRNLFASILITLIALSCVACSGLDTLSDNLKGGVDRLGDDDRRLAEITEQYGAAFCCKTDFDLLEKIKEMGMRAALMNNLGGGAL